MSPTSEGVLDLGEENAEDFVTTSWDHKELWTLQGDPSTLGWGSKGINPKIK